MSSTNDSFDQPMDESPQSLVNPPVDALVDAPVDAPINAAIKETNDSPQAMSIADPMQTQDIPEWDIKAKEALEARKNKMKSDQTALLLKLEEEAKSYLDQFYIQYNEQKELRMQEIEKREAELKAHSLPGSNQWLNALKLIDQKKSILNVSTNSDRMRAVMLERSKQVDHK